MIGVSDFKALTLGIMIVLVAVMPKIECDWVEQAQSPSISAEHAQWQGIVG